MVNQSSLKKYLTKKVISAAFVSLRRDNVRLTHAIRKSYDYRMKSNLKLLLAATVIAAAGTVLVGGAGASASSLTGQACPAAGSTLKVANTTYTCASVHVVKTVIVKGKPVKKTVTVTQWDKGVTVTPITLPSQNFDTTPAGALLWQESFNQNGPLFSQNYDNGTGVNNAVPVTKYWSAVTGYGTYGTGEIENNVASAATEDGVGDLIITATCIVSTNPGCQSTQQQMGQTWTSARIWTENKATFQYGQLEARIWMPAGKWNWPAFWMMGQDYTNPQTPWPLCGELDIAEGLNNESIDGATIHANVPNSSTDWGGGSGLNQKAPITGDQMTSGYHTYGILWKPNSISYILDGKVWASDVYDPKTYDVTQTVMGSTPGSYVSAQYGPGQIPGAGGDWPFNQPFFLILNDAIGGIVSPQAPNGTTSQLKISWVKYYKYQGYGNFVS